MMTQYVAGSTGQRPNAGGKLTGVRSMAAVSGQPYAVPAEARAPLIGQGETNRAERTGPNWVDGRRIGLAKASRPGPSRSGFERHDAVVTADAIDMEV